MRVVSDFLDRVAARVIGGDTAVLTPRIPSIYEPSQVAQNAPMEQSLSIAARADSSRGDDIATQGRAASAETSSAHEPALAPHDDGIGHGRTRAAIAVREGTRQPSTIHAEEAARPSFAKRVAIEPLTHRIAPESKAEVPSFAPEAQPPVAARAAAVPEHAVGVLLPPEQPVFGASTGRVATPASAPERSRARAVPAQGATHEPVVHVSIGRIEVRASAASASAPRRQGGAPVDRLGDYLRERSKASP